MLAAVPNLYVALAFVIGILCSMASGFIGNSIAIRANGRIKFAAQGGLGRAPHVAFSGCALMGMAVVSLAALGISGTY